MAFFSRCMQKLFGHKNQALPHLAVYSLIILDKLVQQQTDIHSVYQAIDHYPEDTRREGNVRQNMRKFVSVFEDYDALKKAIEKQFIEQGGMSAVESQQETMEKLESWYED